MRKLVKAFLIILYLTLVALSSSKEFYAINEFSHHTLCSDIGRPSDLYKATSGVSRRVRIRTSAFGAISVFIQYMLRMPCMLKHLQNLIAYVLERLEGVEGEIHKSLN